VSRIRAATIRTIYDSRGKPTVEVRIETPDGTGIAGAPSGASTGAHEVQAFPKGGVPAAEGFFRKHAAPVLVGLEVAEQSAFDARLHEVDGTPTFAQLGGNVATAASLACARAHAEAMGKELWEVVKRPGVTSAKFPAIVGNCLNGGRHAIGGPEIQEFHAFAPSTRPEESVRVALAVHRAVGSALQKKLPNYALGRGDEGGWVAPVGNLEALKILVDACHAAADELHLPVYPGLDLAASEFYREGKYRYREHALTPEQQVEFLARLADEHGLRYLEDPFQEEDFAGFAALTQAVGGKTLVVGDDLYTTDRARLQRGIDQKASNAILIKVNQVGTLTDTFATIDLARSHGIATVTSHRSGDLPDGWLAHLAVASGAAGLKCGLLGGERVAKLNELLRLGGPHRSPED
jgi:enolase